MQEIRRVKAMLKECGIALAPGSLADIRNDFALTFLRSAGWLVERGGKRTYRWQKVEDAWNAAKENSRT